MELLALEDQLNEHELFQEYIATFNEDFRDHSFKLQRAYRQTLNFTLKSLIPIGDKMN